MDPDPKGIHLLVSFVGNVGQVTRDKANKLTGDELLGSGNVCLTRLVHRQEVTTDDKFLSARSRHNPDWFCLGLLAPRPNVSWLLKRDSLGRTEIAILEVSLDGTGVADRCPPAGPFDHFYYLL